MLIQHLNPLAPILAADFFLQLKGFFDFARITRTQEERRTETKAKSDRRLQDQQKRCEALAGVNLAAGKYLNQLSIEFISIEVPSCYL